MFSKLTITILNLDRHNSTSPNYPLCHLSCSWTLPMSTEGSVPHIFSPEKGLPVSGVPLLPGILSPLLSSSQHFSLCALIYICLKYKRVPYPEAVDTKVWWSNRLQRTFRRSQWDSSMQHTCSTVCHQLLHLLCSIIAGVVQCSLLQSRWDL